MKEQSSLAKRMALLLGVTAAGLVSLLGSGGGEVARPFNASCTSGSFRLRAVETQLTGPAGMATSEAPKRWQERGIWELMKAADPRLREELMTAWAERDAALAKIRRANGVLDDLSLRLPGLRGILRNVKSALAGPEDRNERCPS